MQALLEAGGATQIEICAEESTHQLTTPEDGWTMALGGGYRGIIDQLDPAAKERLRQTNISFLRTNEVNSLDVDVLYATAQK